VSRSKLETVLANWEQEGGDLPHEISQLGTYLVTTREDAAAICHALASPRLSSPDGDAPTSSSLHALIGLFQNVDSKEAYEEMVSNGLPHLRRTLRERMATADERDADDLLFILKILAIYGRPEDGDLIVEAARLPLAPEGYLWSVIFGQLDEDHPAWRKVCDALRTPLPEGFVCVAYLDFVNGHAVRGSLDDHPFAAPAGVAKLRAWLSDQDEEHSDYARSAATALAFVPEEPRKELLDLATAHPDSGVRMEAAWAMARLGDERGKEQLRQWCLDVNLSRTACAYLEELGFEDEVPQECRDPDFRAMAEMCNWLAHPMEFGRPPDKIELYDKRELYWPPTNDRRPVWLFKYTYLPKNESGEPDIGIAMVGSVTFALFGEATEDLSPEDVYALHCCWELEANEDPRAPTERTPQNGRRILAQKNKGFN
jgi:hypothetical protein